MSTGKEIADTMIRLELESRIQSLEENLQLEKSKKLQKLKWLGRPEQFGYIFSELAKHGFIEIPSTKGEGSYSKYAKVCFDLFEFDKTTCDNLERVLNPEKNKLSESNRAKITIPDLADIF